MAWARIDDGFYDHPKITRIFDQEPGAVALLVFMISHCARHETDGLVRTSTAARLAPVQRDRDRWLALLVAETALHEHEDGFVVNSYLEYNPSKAQIRERREADAERKRTSRRKEDG